METNEYRPDYAVPPGWDPRGAPRSVGIFARGVRETMRPTGETHQRDHLRESSD